MHFNWEVLERICAEASGTRSCILTYCLHLFAICFARMIIPFGLGPMGSWMIPAMDYPRLECPHILVCDGYRCASDSKFRSGVVTAERAHAYDT